MSIITVKRAYAERERPAELAALSREILEEAK